MSTVIDENVVELKFDNAQFESGVRESMQSIDNLERKLDIEQGAQNFKLQFSAMQVVAFTVISEITKSAINLGKNLNNMLFGQIKTGGFSRASKIEDAKFMLKGLGVAWDEIEEDINYGVADTAYGLDAAAKAASQLVASGVKFGKESEQMKNTLRGISGVAAMTNSTYEDTAAIFTTIAGQGRVMTMQLRQLEARGLNVAATMGQQLGKTEAEIRDMVTKGQIDFDTFASAMDNAFGEHAKDANKTLTGVLSNIRSALSKIGADFFTPIIQNEGVLVNMLDSIRAMFNLIRKFIQPTVQGMAAAVNDLFANIKSFIDTKLLYKSVDSTGKIVSNLTVKVKIFLTSIKNLFKSFAKTVASFILPIAQAFKEVFSEGVMTSLTNLNGLLVELFDNMRLTDTGMNNLKRTFRGLFSVVSLIKDIFVSLFKATIPSVKNCSSLLEIILSLTAEVGDAAVNFTNWFRKTGILNAAIQVLSGLLNTLLFVIKQVASGMSEVFIALSHSDVATKAFKALGIILSIVAVAIKEVLLWIASLINNLDVLPKTISNIVAATVALLSQIPIFKSLFEILNKIAETIKIVTIKICDFIQVLDADGVYKFGKALAFLVSAFAFLRLATGINKMTKSIASLISAFKNFMFPFANQKKKGPADIALKFAIAIGIIAGSLYLLSTIPVEKLTQVITVLGIICTTIIVLQSLNVAIKGMMKDVIDLQAEAKALKSISKSLMLVSIASSIYLFIEAFKALEGINLDKIVSTLIKVTVVLGLLIGLTAIISIMQKNLSATKENAFGWISSAATILSLSYGAKLISEAIKTLAELKAGTIKQAGISLGLVSICFGIMGAAASGLKISNVLGFLLFAKTINLVLPEIVQMVEYIKSHLDVKKIRQTLAQYTNVLPLLLVAIGGFAAIFGAFKIGEQFSKFMSGIIKMEAAIVILVFVCKFINENKSEVEQAIGSLKKFILMIALLEALSISTGWADMAAFSSSLKGIAIAVFALAAIAVALAYISNETGLDTSAAVKSIMGITLCLAALEGMSYFANRIHPKELIQLAHIIMMIAASLALLAYATNDSNKLIASMISLTGVMIAFTAMSAVLTKIKPDPAKLSEIALMMSPILGIVLMLIFFENATSGMDFKKIISDATAITLVMAAFTGMVAALNKIGMVTIDGVGVISTLGTMIAIATILGAFGNLTKSLNYGQLIADAAGLSLCMVAMSEMLYVIGAKMKGTHVFNAAKAKMLGASIIEMVGIAGILLIFAHLTSSLDPATIITSAAGLSACMVAFSKLLDTTSALIGTKTEKLNIAPIIATALSMVGLAITLGLFAHYTKDISWQNLITSAIGLGSTLIAFGYVLQIIGSIGKFDTNIIIALITCVFPIVTLAISLGELAKIPAGSLVTAMLEMASVFAALGFMLTAASSVGAVGALPLLYSMVPVITVLITIAASLKALADEDLAGIAVSAISTIAIMCTCILLIGSLGSILSTMTWGTLIASGGSLLVFAVLLGAVAGSLWTLAQFDWKNILAAAVSMVSVLAVILAIAALLTASKVLGGVAIAVLVIGILALGAALQPLAGSLNDIAVSLTMIKKAGLDEITNGLINVKTAIDALYSNIKELNAIADSFAKFVESMSNISEISSDIFDPLKEEFVKKANELSNALYNSMNLAGQNFVNGFVDGVEQRISELTKSIDGFSKMITSATLQIGSLFALIQSSMGPALNSLPTTLSAVTSQFAALTYSVNMIMMSGMIDAGKNTVLGLVQGIRENMGSVTDIMILLANSVLKSFRTVMGIHSPSWEAHKDGNYIVQGLIDGIRENSKRAIDSAGELGTSVGRKLAENIRTERENVKNATRDLTDAVKDSTEEVTQTAREVYESGAETYRNFLENLATSAYGKNLNELTSEELANIEQMSTAIEAIYQQEKQLEIDGQEWREGTITEMKDRLAGMGIAYDDALREDVAGLENLTFQSKNAVEAELDALQDDSYLTFNEIRKQTNQAMIQIQETYSAQQNYLAGIGEGFLTGFTAIFKFVGLCLQTLLEDAKGFLTAMGVELPDFSKSKEEFENGMNEAVTSVTENMVENVSTSLEDALGDVYSSNDDYYADYIENHIEGLKEEEKLAEDEKKSVEELNAELEESAARIETLISRAQLVRQMGADPESDYYRELIDAIEEEKENSAYLENLINQKSAQDAAGADATDDATKAAEKYADAMDDLKDSIEDALKSNEHFNRTVTDSSKTIISNLKSQVSGVTEWANDLVKLASRGASQALVEELGEMGTDGYSMLQAYLTMTDEQLAEVNEIYENRATLEKQALAKVNASYALAGNQNASSYLKSLGYSLSQVEQLVAEEAEAANKQFNENLVKFADAEPYTDEYNELKTYFQELGYTTKDVASMIEKANGNINVSLRNLEMEEAFKKVEAAYYSMYSIISDASDPFTEFTRSFEVTKESLFKNLNSQVNGFAEWSNKLIILANRGVSRGIIGALEEAGPESVDKIDAMLDMTSEELEKYMELWENTESNIEDTSRSMMMALALTGDEDAIEYFKTLGMSIEDVQKQADILDAQTFQLTNMKNAAKEVQEEFSNLYDTIKGQIDIFEAFDTSAEMSGDEMLENMQSQIDGVKEWSKNLTELAGRGMSEGLLKELSDLGPDGYEKVAAFVDMTDDQLREANDLFAESLTLPMSTAGEVMSSYAKAGDQAAADFINSLGLSANNAEAVGKAFVDAFSLGISNELDLAKDSGSDLMSGFLSGLDEMGENVLTESDTLSTNILDTMREVLGIHSPSKETTAMGKYLCQGFSDGMHNNKTKVVADAISMGKDIVNGLINGINNQVNRAYSSVTSFANKILTVARNTLGINSPSKKFAEIGMYSVMGMCDGIKNYAYLASDAANELSNDTLNIVQEAIDSILEIINSDEDALVIRPILDLSNIQEGANKISSMFKQKELSMAIDADGNQNGSKTGIGASYTFNQYNTSPKALDRIEIYRQTKNQFSMLRGMV